MKDFEYVNLGKDYGPTGNVRQFSRELDKRVLRATSGQLGGYHIAADIPMVEGTSGIFMGAQNPDGRLVAVKLGVSSNRRAQEYAVREAAFQARVAHETGAVPDVFEVDTVHVEADVKRDGGTNHVEGDFPLIAMEYVPGETMARTLYRRPIRDPQSARERLSGVAAAVDAMGETGVVHMDIKPANTIERERDGKTDSVVIDFDTSVEADTILDEACGSAGSIAPEQVPQPTTVASTKINIWQFGSLAYASMTGEPFVLAKDTWRENGYLTGDAYNDYHKRRITRSGLHVPLQGVFLKAGALTPSDRYDTGTELLDGLVKALETPETTIIDLHERA